MRGAGGRRGFHGLGSFRGSERVPAKGDRRLQEGRRRAVRASHFFLFPVKLVEAPRLKTSRSAPPGLAARVTLPPSRTEIARPPTCRRTSRKRPSTPTCRWYL